MQSTGTGRSPVHNLDVMDNTLHSQHLKDEDARRGGEMYKIRGAGPGGTVLGRTAGGATRSNTEDRGAGPDVKVLGRTAEGAMRSNTDKVVRSIRGGVRL